MGTMNRMDARNCEIEEPGRYPMQILRLVREMFANAAPTKASGSMPTSGIVR
jgi:hypothetical protein